MFAKDGKGYLFLSILLSLKTIGKGVKFQDITLIRATFTNTIANGTVSSRISILFFVINNVAKSLKELVFDPPE